MTKDFGIATDIDQFYSELPPEVWQPIIGEQLHYHFGRYLPGDSFEDGVQRTVRTFYPWIPKESRVLDVGCGWGGPMSMLREELSCEVTGITISQAQATYAQSLGLDVRHMDAGREFPEGDFDVALMLESLCHMGDIEDILARLRQKTKVIVLSECCCSDDYEGEREGAFGGSMRMRSPAELEAAFESTGWRVLHRENWVSFALPSIVYWKHHLDKIYGESVPPGQLAVLRRLTDAALKDWAGWSRMFPLMDYVVTAE